MTDRLSTLLHDEAAAIAVPPVPDLVPAGHRAVRRRRTRTALVGAVAAALVAVGASVAVDRWRGHDGVEPADGLSYEQQGVWISGDEAHVGTHVVPLRGSLAGGIDYTAVGAVVRSADPGSGRTFLTLVSPDGRTRDLGEVDALATDVTSSTVVIETSTGPHTRQLATWDLTTDVRRPLGEPFRTQGDPGSTLALSGPYVVFQRGQRMVMMDRDTGRVQRLPQEELGLTTFQSFGPAGYLTAPEGAPVHVTEWHVRSLPDGDLVGTYPDGGDQVASISPDGRYLLTSGDAGSELYDVASGEALPLGFPERRTSGWSPDGHVVTTSPGGTVLVCAPTTGACTDTGEPAGDDLTVARGSYNSWS